MLNLMGGERSARAGVPEGEARLNYRHHFHAGNFADLVKHALLLALLERLTAAPGPLEVVDTHAGAGLYDITGEAARRSAEAEAGVVKLMAAPDAPQALLSLRKAVATLNEGTVRLYPGSPVLAVRALRPGDRYEGFELRPDDQSDLARSLKQHAPKGVSAKAVLGDGFTALERSEHRRLVLIDPPFERGDDYERMAAAVACAAAPATTFALWTPLKDLETFDAFLGALERARIDAAGFAAQARLRPLDNPLRLNGCALVLIGDPTLLEAVRPDAQAVCGWTTKQLGEAGAAARLEPLFFSN